MPDPVQINRDKMKEVLLADTVDPFGKINYEDRPDGTRVVMATIRADFTREGSRMGMAIDGSGSMEPLFGKKQISAFLPAQPNHVAPAAQAMSSFLAKKAADGKVSVIYWATGVGGKEIQAIGDLTVTEAEKYKFSPPNIYGTGTRLLPALRYFTDAALRKDLYDAEWGMYVFITDGQLEDLEEVKEYCTKMARDIEAGRRHDLKLVIIGLGDQVDQSQLDQLDDLDTGTEVDLWDAQLAKDMKSLEDIFNEVWNEELILVPSDGVIRDENGSVVVNYRDTGLPARILFALPRGATKAFTLEVAGNSVRQNLG